MKTLPSGAAMSEAIVNILRSSPELACELLAAEPKFSCRLRAGTGLACRLAGLLLLAASARAQVVANVSITPPSGTAANGVIQTFAANYSDTSHRYYPDRP
jgi:hypothetical protein